MSKKKQFIFLLVIVIVFAKFNLLFAAAKPENVLVVINDASSELESFCEFDLILTFDYFCLV